MAKNKDTQNEQTGFGRRFVLGSGAVAGIAGLGAAVGLNATGGKLHAAAGNGLSAEIRPGELDHYYGFWSGGHSGEVRVLGIPSGRELKRIPVFNYDAAYGWGTTNYSKRLLKGKNSGDTHHVHLSYNNGTYDGRYAFVNDKAQARLARIRLDHFVVDEITEIPHAQGTHGIFPSRHGTQVHVPRHAHLPAHLHGLGVDAGVQGPVVPGVLQVAAVIGQRRTEFPWPR